MKTSARLVIRHILFDNIDRLLKISFRGTKDYPVWSSPICLVYGSASHELFDRLNVGDEIDITWCPLPGGRLAFIISVGMEKNGKFIVRYIYPTEAGDTKLTCFPPFRAF